MTVCRPGEQFQGSVGWSALDHPALSNVRLDSHYLCQPIEKDHVDGVWHAEGMDRTAGREQKTLIMLQRSLTKQTPKAAVPGTGLIGFDYDIMPSH